MAEKRTPVPIEIHSVVDGTLYAIVGGVATRLYQPERFTKDLDVLVHVDDLALLQKRLEDTGARRTGSLSLPDSQLGLEGEVWQIPHTGEVDVLWSTQPWVLDAVRSTNRDEEDFAIISLPYLIAMKLDASRSVDQGDLSRMLGFAADFELAEVRRIVPMLLSGIGEDLESYIELGRLEIGDAHRDRGRSR